MIVTIAAARRMRLAQRCARGAQGSSGVRAITSSAVPWCLSVGAATTQRVQRPAAALLRRTKFDAGLDGDHRPKSVVRGHSQHLHAVVHRYSYVISPITGTSCAI